MEPLIGQFHQSARGLICKKVPDYGTWILPESEEGVVPGERYVLQVTRTSKEGGVRYAKILESFKDLQKRTKATITAALENGRVETDPWGVQSVRVDDVNAGFVWILYPYEVKGSTFLCSHLLESRWVATSSICDLLKKGREAFEEERRLEKEKLREHQRERTKKEKNKQLQRELELNPWRDAVRQAFPETVSLEDTTAAFEQWANKTGVGFVRTEYWQCRQYSGTQKVFSLLGREFVVKNDDCYNSYRDDWD